MLRRRLPDLPHLLTEAGWLVLGLGGAAWIGAWRLGWNELAVVAAASLLAVMTGLAFTAGRMALRVSLDLQPARVVVGDDAVGRVTVVNEAARRVLPVRLEVPVGDGVALVQVPPLARDEEHVEVLVIRTDRRRVLRVGPVTSVRGDPLGLVRRAVAWSGTVELYVHPQTKFVSSLSAGWLRDLEGSTTNDRSNSDIAFHTLREYVPGDDRRHVHWRTSARLNKLMVREFVDTRRSRLAIVLPTAAGAYADADEFEFSVSVAGSLGKTVLRLEQELQVIAGPSKVACQSADRLLDGLAGIELGVGPDTLDETARRAGPSVRGSSVVVLVCGAATSATVVQAAASRMATGGRVVVLRCGVGITAGQRSGASTLIIDVGSLDDLDRAVRMVAQR